MPRITFTPALYQAQVQNSVHADVDAAPSWQGKAEPWSVVDRFESSHGDAGWKRAGPPLFAFRITKHDDQFALEAPNIPAKIKAKQKIQIQISGMDLFERDPVPGLAPWNWPLNKASQQACDELENALARLSERYPHLEVVQLPEFAFSVPPKSETWIDRLSSRNVYSVLSEKD
jgi:hypothetical protein